MAFQIGLCVIPSGTYVTVLNINMYIRPLSSRPILRGLQIKAYLSTDHLTVKVKYSVG